MVFIPSLKDIHQDHSTIAQEGLRAFKNTSILGYELIWNNLSFDTTSFIPLEKRHVQAKADSLKEYKSQGQRDYMSTEFIFSLLLFGKLTFNFGLNSFSFGLTSLNNILVITLSVSAFFVLVQKAESEFKEHPKIKIRKKYENLFIKISV